MGASNEVCTLNEGRHVSCLRDAISSITISMTTAPLGSPDSPHDPSAAEEAGAAAYRAGMPRESVPSLCGCADAGGIAGHECLELVESWCRGWDRTQLLQEVSDRMFPASAARPAMLTWAAFRKALPQGAATT